jgi:hypothetical protein
MRALATTPARVGEISDYAITDHLVLALANEGVRALEDEVTTGPRELDLATVFGMGFPPFRGGLLRWCDSLGAAEICARLARVGGSHEVLMRREGPERFGRRACWSSSPRAAGASTPDQGSTSNVTGPATLGCPPGTCTAHASCTPT